MDPNKIEEDNSFRENSQKEQSDEKMFEDKKPEGPKSSFIIVLILLLLLIFGGAYYYGTQSKKEVATPSVSPSPTASETIEASVSPTPTETAAGCKSTLTASDKEMVKTWKTYKNLKYNFSFLYPENWKIEDQQDDRVVLSDSDAKLNFYFTSADMSAFDLMQYKKDSEKNIKVACESATEVFMTGDPSTGGGTTSEMKDIVTSFKKNAIPHVVMMDYLSQGASISSDIVEAYDIILKTVEFK